VPIKGDWALDQVALSYYGVDKLLPTETEIKDEDYPLFGSFYYIGQRGKTLIAFSCNIFEATAGEVKKIGKFDKLFRYDVFGRME